MNSALEQDAFEKVVQKHLAHSSLYGSDILS